MSKQRHMHRWLWLVPLAICVGLMYSSSMSYSDQSLIDQLQVWLSNQPLREVFERVNFTYAQAEISIQELGYWHFVEFFIRKGAHFIIFGLLGLSLYRPLSYELNRKQAALWALGLTFIFACLDEGHQAMTPERAGLWVDVMLDTCGAAVFIGSVYTWQMMNDR